MQIFNAIAHSRDRQVALYISLNGVIILLILAFADATKLNFAVISIIGGIVLLATSLLLFGLLYRLRSLKEDEKTNPDQDQKANPDLPPRPTQPPTIGGLTSEQLKKDKKNKHRTTLSKFAKRRIDKHLLGYANAPLIFEQRKEAIELFVQLEPRKPTGKYVKRPWRKKPKEKLTESSTIYGPAFSFLIALAVFVFVVYIVSLLPPEHFWGYGWFALLVFAVIGLSKLVALYHHWSRWFFWRLVAFDSDKDAHLEGLLVIIDKPFLLPGGGVPPLELRRITLVSASTGKTPEDEKTRRSIAAGMLDYEWLLMDSDAQMDERFNWVGPFKNAPQLVMKINRARHNASMR